MTEEKEMAVQEVNRIVGRGQAISEAMTVLKAMMISGLGPEDFMDWLEAEQSLNILNLHAAGERLAQAVQHKDRQSGNDF